LTVDLRELSWDRMLEAVQAVRERALRATAGLEKAWIPYAMAGGNAVAAWVSRVDRAAVRNTQDFEILVRRSDLPAVKAALAGAGSCRPRSWTWLASSTAKGAAGGTPSTRSSPVNKVRDSYPLPTADVTERVEADDYCIVSLEALVRMQLNSFRRKDQMHLLDLGLIDAPWLPRLVSERAARL
jgi:hypothetical protein